MRPDGVGYVGRWHLAPHAAASRRAAARRRRRSPRAGRRLGLVLFVALIAGWPPPAPRACSADVGGAAGRSRSAPPGAGQRVGATEYGGPGDPQQRGTSARPGSTCWRIPTATPSSAAPTFQTATAMGGLPYMTPLRITWGAHSAIAYKRDFGFGGGPVAGLPAGDRPVVAVRAGRSGSPTRTGCGRARSRIGSARRPPAPASRARPVGRRGAAGRRGARRGHAAARAALRPARRRRRCR